MGIAKPYTQLHPAPSISTYLHPAHIGLHPGLWSGLRFSKFPRQNPFLEKFGPKKYSSFIFIWDLAAVFGQSSAVFYSRFWKYEVPMFLFYREIKRRKFSRLQEIHTFQQKLKVEFKVHLKCLILLIF